MNPLDRTREFVSRQLHSLERRGRVLLPFLFVNPTTTLDLRIVSRTLIHAALVGVAAGLVGAAFFYGLEWVQTLLFEDLAGYTVLRAAGEATVEPHVDHGFRPWLLLLIPALGGLAAGLVSQFAPETRGGGADATIAAFHHQGGVVRRRVIWVKAIASLFSLGSGGSGGREGPTMQIGGAIGSTVGRLLKVTTRERRILLVAGIAAGISAVFKTPLGAAILAVEILYRDGFESDALIPSVFASVISYSVSISISGESTLFAHAGHFPFIPAHLPLYALLAVFAAALAAVFVFVFRGTHRWFANLPVPAWTKPGIGGLALGLLCTPIIVYVGSRIHVAGQGLGLFGGGYGAVQMAITGADWLPGGWNAVLLLLLMCVTKIVATSLTVGSGGSAGDFAPSLAIGGLLGGAFGRAAQLLLADPRIDPAAFALVGMGVFYGGLAHVPLSAVILVCELAGNYDLLVPLMLAQGIAYIALRKRSLYGAQVASQKESPVHGTGPALDVLRTILVRELLPLGRSGARFTLDASRSQMQSSAEAVPGQEVFPVVDARQAVIGIVTRHSLWAPTAAPDEAARQIAKDLVQPAVSVGVAEDVRAAVERIVANHLREIPVVDEDRRFVAMITEDDISQAYVRAVTRAEAERESAL
jgi:CIC family chloride channel protein